MNIIQTSLSGLVIIEPTVFEDERGWFMESFNEQCFHQQLKSLGLPLPSRFIQDNHSCSNKGVLRGLHYQLAPHMQGKLVRVSKGAVYDVAVDIRKGSPTFGKFEAIELSADNKRMLWIPEGFAHGFLALEDDTQFLYKITANYSNDHEACIKWNDPELAIKWPVDHMPIVSEKDNLGDFVKDIEGLSLSL